MDESMFPVLIRELYTIVDKLEAMFKGRHFTPDGHLVGSIGEAIASYYYGVVLSPASTQGYDGMSNGKKVEIKATQGVGVSLSSCPEHLIVFKLLSNGAFDEHYNGPGHLAWALLANRKSTKNGQRSVSLSALRLIMTKSVDRDEVIEPIRQLPLGTKRAPPKDSQYPSA